MSELFSVSTNQKNTYLDFVRFFEDEYQDRKASNPHYSQRAYARDLGLTPSRLNLILSGKLGLSTKAAEKIVPHLKLDPAKQELFLSLVAAKHSRDLLSKKIANDRLHEISQSDATDQAEERFSILSNWYYATILFLTDLEDFQPNPEWISGRLRITPQDAAKALSELTDAGYLSKENGTYVRSEQHLRFQFKPSNQDIKKYNKQILEKATSSIDEIKPEYREVSTSLMSIRKKDFPYAKNEINKFKRFLTNELVKRSEGSDQVYCFSLQLFPMHEVEEKS